jgi:hypothetical protein
MSIIIRNSQLNDETIAALNKLVDVVSIDVPLFGDE